MSVNKIKKSKIFIRYKTYFTFWRMLNTVIAILLMAGLLLAIYFIRQNINTAFANTITVLEMKSNSQFDSLDLQAYNVAKETIEKKQKINSLPTKLRNIFEYKENIVKKTTTTNEKTVTTKK